MVEKKNGVVPVSKKVAASVLAGIMATGMVPAAAFAEGVTDTSSDSGVELQALTPDKAFSAGQVLDGEGNALSDSYGFGELPVKNKRISVKVNSKKTFKLELDEATGKYYDRDDYARTGKKDLFYTVTYTNDSDVPVTEETVKNNAGSYKLVITATEGTNAPGAAKFAFKVDTGTVEHITVDPNAYNKESGVANDFTYSAEPQKIVFKQSGGGNPILKEDQYKVQYFKKGADLSDPAQALPSTPVDAGEYYAKLTSIGKTEFSVDPIAFEIKQLDLSTADLGTQFNTSIVVGATTQINSKVQLVTVNGSAALASKLQAIEWDRDNGPTGKDLGAYKAKITAKDAADENFVRATSGTDIGKIKTGYSSTFVYRVANATSMEYNGSPMEGQTVNIDSSLGQVWSDNLIKARDKDGVATPFSEISYINVTDGKRDITAPPLESAKEYIVTALWHDTDYEHGAAATMKVSTSSDSVDADTNAIVTFKQQKDDKQGVVTSAIKTIYDGTDIIKRIEYTIKYKQDATHPDGELIEGPSDDYTVEYTDSKGNVVTSIKDAGSYTLTFKSKKFHIKNPSVPITIEPAKIQAIMPFRNVQIDNTDPLYDPTKPDPQYKAQPVAKDNIGNGQSSVIVGSEEVFIRYNDGEKNTNGDLVWKDLPADAVVKITNSKGEEVKKFDKADTYKISVAKPSADSANMEITAPEMTVTATDKVTALDFLDVINPANYTGSDPLPWYNKEVYKAKDLSYIHGYDNNNADGQAHATMFKPEQSITRAEFARVVYNMAGEPENETVRGLRYWKEGQGEAGTYRTDFSDCDDSAWYAKAVAWAHAVGIVKGYDGTSQFRPDQQISRQEVAMMLSRYEKFVAPAQYKSGEGTSLSAYLDSFAVDGWAQGAVQWAVANKVMGVNTNLLNPRNDITRAEVAAMAVRAQPNKLAGA